MASNISLRGCVLRAFIGLLVYFSSPGAAAVDVALVELLADGNITPTSLGRAGAVFDVGVQDITNLYGSTFNFSQIRFPDNTSYYCDASHPRTNSLASRYYYRDAQANPVMILFGSDCPFEYTAIGDLSRDWNKSLMIPVRTTGLCDDKVRCPTVTRFSPGLQDDVSGFTQKAIQRFQFTRVALLCVSYGGNDLYNYQTLCSSFTARFPYATQHTLATNSYKSLDGGALHATLQQIRQEGSTAIIIVAHERLIRPIMLDAYDQGMTNGDYAFFDVEPFPGTAIFGNNSWFRPMTDADEILQDDGRNNDAKAAYQALFVISQPPATAEYLGLERRVKQISSDRYGYTYQPSEEVHPYAMTYYYALRIYGTVLNEAVARGGDPQDGAALSRAAWNRTYNLLGQNYVVSAKGDHLADWSLKQMNQTTGQFQSVLDWSASSGALSDAAPVVWYPGKPFPPVPPVSAPLRTDISPSAPVLKSAPSSSSQTRSGIVGALICVVPAFVFSCLV